MLKAIRNWWTSLPPSRGVGFKEAAKNPRLWKAMTMEGAQEKAFAKETAATISDEDLANLAEYFIFEIAHEDDAWLAGRTLKEVDPARRGLLFESILTKPDNAGRLVKPRPDDSRYGSRTPIERLCRLVDDGICPPSVANFARNPEASIRKAAVLAICATGSLEMVPVFEMAARDNEDYVRSYAMMGLNRALKASRLAAKAVPLLYPIVFQMVREGKNCDESPKLLMALDPVRAVIDMQLANILTVDFPRVFEVLRCFKEPSALPSREKLEELFVGLEQRPRKYPDTYSLGEVLRLIGHHRLPQDESRLSFFMGEENDDVAEGAAAGFLAFHGLERAHEVACVWDAPASTPVPLQQYFAIHMMDAEICNGGFSQYFFNSSGDTWELAMSGLENAGSKERLSLLKKAISNIAGGKPSPNRDIRGGQLAKTLRKNDDVFEDLETRYYASKEHLQVLLAKLVMKHQGIFRSQIESSRSRE